MAVTARNDSGQGRSPNDLIPDGLAPPRGNILAAALGELGVAEDPPRSNRGSIERYFPAWQKRQLASRDEQLGRLCQGPAWCAYYVCWCWAHGMGEHPLGAAIGSVHQMAVRAEQRSLWMPLLGADMVIGPAPGDAFIMLDRAYRRDDVCSGHTGLLLRVSEDGREFVTIEGNSGDRVRIGRRRADDPRMRGVISVTGDLGGGDWERGLGDITAEDVAALGTR